MSEIPIETAEPADARYDSGDEHERWERLRNMFNPDPHGVRRSEVGLVEAAVVYEDAPGVPVGNVIDETSELPRERGPDTKEVRVEVEEPGDNNSDAVTEAVDDSADADPFVDWARAMEEISASVGRPEPERSSGELVTARTSREVVEMPDQTPEIIEATTPQREDLKNWYRELPETTRDARINMATATLLLMAEAAASTEENMPTTDSAANESVDAQMRRALESPGSVQAMILAAKPREGSIGEAYENADPRRLRESLPDISPAEVVKRLAYTPEEIELYNDLITRERAAQQELVGGWRVKYRDATAGNARDVSSLLKKQEGELKKLGGFVDMDMSMGRKGNAAERIGDYINNQLKRLDTLYSSVQTLEAQVTQKNGGRSQDIEETKGVASGVQEALPPTDGHLYRMTLKMGLDYYRLLKAQKPDAAEEALAANLQAIVTARQERRAYTARHKSPEDYIIGVRKEASDREYVNDLALLHLIQLQQAGMKGGDDSTAGVVVEQIRREVRDFINVQRIRDPGMQKSQEMTEDMVAANFRAELDVAYLSYANALRTNRNEAVKMLNQSAQDITGQLKAAEQHGQLRRGTIPDTEVGFTRDDIVIMGEPRIRELLEHTANRINELASHGAADETLRQYFKMLQGVVEDVELRPDVIEAEARRVKAERRAQGMFGAANTLVVQGFTPLGQTQPGVACTYLLTMGRPREQTVTTDMRTFNGREWVDVVPVVTRREGQTVETSNPAKIAIFEGQMPSGYPEVLDKVVAPGGVCIIEERHNEGTVAKLHKQLTDPNTPIHKHFHFQYVESPNMIFTRDRHGNPVINDGPSGRVLVLFRRLADGSPNPLLGEGEA